MQSETEYQNYQDEVIEAVEPTSNQNHDILIKFQEGQLLCAICYVQKQKSMFYSIFQCSHSFCKYCLIENTNACLLRGSQIVCPQCSATSKGYDEHGLFTSEQIRRLKKTQLRMKISGNQSLRLCPDEYCVEGVIQIKNNESKGTCKVCKTVYCGKCMLKQHFGECQTVAVKIIKNKRYQKCAQCSHYIEKSSGCPHMTCRCKHQFCYYCGGKWVNKFCCLKRQYGIQETFVDKIDKILGKIKSERYQDDYGIRGKLGYLINIPFAILYGLAFLLWVVWTILWVLAFIVFLLCGCCIIGYFRAFYAIIKEKSYWSMTKRILSVVLLIVLAPLGIVVIGIGLFLSTLYKCYRQKIIIPTIQGSLSPLFKCSFD